MRKTLSSSQKANITKKVAEYGHFLKHPELFYAPHVQKRRAKELKTSGYKVTPSGRAIIPLKEFTSAKLGKGSIVFKNGDLTEDVKLVGAKNFHNELKKLAGMKLTRHQMVTVKIGDNRSFKRSYTSYAELHNYLAHEFSPKDSGTKNRLKRVNELMPKMSIVTVTEHAKKKRVKKQIDKSFEELFAEIFEEIFGEPFGKPPNNRKNAKKKTTRKKTRSNRLRN